MKRPYQLGDIIIFKAEDDILSKCIAWLTNSDVSHSAMIYTEDSIIESVAPGVVTHTIQTGTGDAAYVLRLAPEKAPQPLLHAAQRYLDAHTHYNFPALLYLAGLLMFRRIKPTTKLLRIADHIITLACLELDNILQKLARHPENRSMVCSQFVYQVYLDCGFEYQIQVHADCTKVENQRSDTVLLFELCDQNYIPPLDSFCESPYSNDSPEELMCRLYKAFVESDEENTIVAEASLIQSTVNTFYNKLQQLMKILETDLPVDSLFVTPADFLYHAKNLKMVEEIKLTRVL